MFKLDHFAFEVSDLERSVAFYRDALGFVVEERFTDLEEHEILAVLALAGGRLELIQALSRDNQSQDFNRPEIQPHCCPHLALETDDLDAAMENMRLMNVETAKAKVENEYARWMYVLDPDGNCIELFEPENGKKNCSKEIMKDGVKL